MKKISSKNNIFRSIIRFFDKWLITPIMKIILYISDFFKNNNNGIERILNNRQALVIISLLFALLAFYAIDRQGVSLVDDNAEILYGIPVNAIYNKQAYVIEGLSDTVDVTLIGKKWSVYLAKQYPAEEVTVDLSDLTPGTHKISLNYKKKVKAVDYKVDPSNVTVVVYKKISETKEVTADIVHKDHLDSRLTIENEDVVLSRDTVTVKGAQYKVDRVASVKALIDIDSLPNQEVGKYTLSDVKLVAYDSDGNPVDVEIVPDSLSADVEVTSPMKVVPIKIITTGELDGKAIKTLSSNVEEVTLYGSKDALDKIEYLPVTIDVSGINSDKNYTVNLINPSGVRKISVKTITVKLSLDEVVSREISNIKVKYTNLADEYNAQAYDQNSSSITVIVKGSKSVIDDIDESKISAFVDLGGLGVGEHDVEVTVTGDDNKLTYTPRVKKVTVVIMKK